jgi:hypothetical protein
MISEFLFEQNSPDDLYFYLTCRNMVFRGPCLGNKSATFEVVQYIALEHAEFVVDTVMSKYDSNNLLQVKRVLREKAKRKILTSNRLTIDAYFVLRILLEFYRVERKNRLKMLRETFGACQSLQSNGKFGVSFKNFKKIFEINFPKASDLEVPNPHRSKMCTLYRDSHMLGGGGVTAETFFAAATESDFFLQWLQLKTLTPTPSLDPESGNIQYNEENIAYIEFQN